MVHDNAALAEEMVELAKEVILKGVIQGEMSPNIAQHQVIVAGAMVILAAANAGLSLGDALNRVVGGAPEDDEDGKFDGHPGQYL